VEQFKDLLRVLYTLYVVPLVDLQKLTSSLYSPLDLPTTEIDERSALKLPHLLNVAELSRKYNLTAFELWAMEYITLIIASGYLLSPKAKVDLEKSYARILRIALEGHHTQVIDAVAPRLIGRILWYDYRPEASFIRSVEKYAKGNEMLSNLLGAMYYRVMIDVRSPNKTLSIPKSLRPRFADAEHALVLEWDQLRRTPPTLPSAEQVPGDDENDEQAWMKSVYINPHSKCVGDWMQLWMSMANGLSHGPFPEADVLGKLKYMNTDFKKKLANGPDMCMECSMGALEVLTTLRDKIIYSLPSAFGIY
jgi:hypothetical protein